MLSSGKALTGSGIVTDGFSWTVIFCPGRLESNEIAVDIKVEQLHNEF